MNHNSRKPINRFGRNAPIDGLSNRPSQRFNQGGSPGNFGISSGRRPASVSGSQKPVNVLNDFKRPDGFNPTRQQQIQRGPAQQQPILVERPSAPKKKRGLFKKTPKNPNAPVKTKKKASKKKKFLRILIVLILLGLIVGGFLFAKGYFTLRKVLPGGGGAAALQQNVDPSKLKGEGDGRVNILLLGRGGEGHEGADLTDTIILASIDPVAKEAALVSIPRDLYVPVQGKGSMKINAVFSTGKSNANNARSSQKSVKQAEAAGFALLEETIETQLGVPVHYHLMVDFQGFKQAIDTVGGIELNAPDSVTETMRIDGRTYKLDVKAGQQKMDGFKALAYARSRHTSPRGDFDRAERQRVIITALKDKILSAGTFSNPQKISSLLDTFGDHVQTNFSTADLQRLYQLSKEIPSSKISSIGLSDPPNNFVTTSNIAGASVVIPTAGNGNFKDIQSFMRNALKDSYIKNENASIMVLNGTAKTGLATTKGDELKSYGYNITQVGNAPTKTYTQTVIVDLRSGSKKYTLSYLEKRFNVKATGQMPDPAIVPGAADFVIILGSDQTQ